MNIDTGTNELLCVVREGVALITLNRPEARNAMSEKLTPALRTQIKERGDDPDVGAILITGAGESPQLSRILGTIAVVASTINIVSGFLITDRMLKMFRKKEGAKPSK